MGQNQHGLAVERTVLFQRHVDLNGRMVPFGGWEMPLQYQGIVAEHKAVREKVGIFDVSHMGRILCTGPDAAKFLDSLSTNSVLPKKSGMAIYTVLPNEEGGSVDDAIIYKTDDTHLTIVVNASNREKDLKHFRDHQEGYDVTITPRYETDGILAVQGPLALEVVGALFPESEALKPMRFALMEWNGKTVEVARSGYTGSDGFELSADNAVILALWDILAAKCTPCGLGARDTLRLEAGFALYGHELTDTILPTESISAWTVKSKERLFLGSDQMKFPKRKQFAVQLNGRGIARQGDHVFQNGKHIGEVTSGSFGPTVNKAIALVIVSELLELKDAVQIEIRGKPVSAEVVSLPFYRR